MKTSTFVIAALFASVQADAPPYFNEPPFAVSTHPSAAGLIQLQTACANSGISGVTCGPSDEELFATGMNGDEDLGEDITMKGDKFHFVQNVQLSAEPAAEEKAPVPAGTAAPAAGAAEKKGKVIYDTKGYGPVEKISFFDPKIAKAHTSFYAQAEPAAATTAAANATASATTPAAKYPAPEKVHTLDPKIAKAHTTFYNSQKSALIQIEMEDIPKTESADTFTGVKNFPYPGPEQVHTLDPKIAKGHTTFYNKQ